MNAMSPQANDLCCLVTGDSVERRNILLFEFLDVLGSPSQPLFRGD